ncbi:hypothetical protein [Mangrovimonas sp. DI 80]|uniref:hypothetical protein n=1 Tax=Mangrovimonas sp. DI 80 TaxID=1779330 RepID=UPI000975ED3E|nr:hypothetical protein [Mangrovimonas sp. DI 80]OMP32281.1 hypothetical protein BKM32_04310 [Mangrovimonas sp. DI 80]
MAYLEDHKAKFEDLNVSLDAKNRHQLKRKANGGNSIIFTYPPDEEILYTNKFMSLNEDQQYQFIDISKLLVDFIDLDGWKDFEAYYKDFKDTPHIIFKSDDESTDLMDLIINEIIAADQNGKIPVLTRTGALYGTGIENVNIMEHKTVMTLNNPLVIMYPSKIENENLYFLNFKLASKYRCTVID